MGNKITGRDYPLSVTPVDKLRTTHPSLKEISFKSDVPSYTYKKGSYTKEDSSSYKKGYLSAKDEVARNPEGKGHIGGKFEKGYRAAGLSDSYNAGFSEGKDKVLNKK